MYIVFTVQTMILEGRVFDKKFMHNYKKYKIKADFSILEFIDRGRLILHNMVF